MKNYIEKRRYFPDPAKTTMDGIVAMGDEISTDILLEAYSFGIFPWPHPDLPCLWFCPDQRGVIDFKDMHISESLKKFLRKCNWRITWNTCFEEVIRESAETPRPGQGGTWITEPLIRAYCQFNKAGYAQSIECWEGGDLIGGLYGVYVGGVFSGESMFYKKSNASKFCLVKLIEVLKEQGLSWLDIQMVTPVTEALGGKYITKREFLKRVHEAHHIKTPGK